MRTLDLIEAATFLGIHPNTLQARAKSGAIPGAKVGRAWRFIDVDLAEHLRAQYPANQPQEAPPCRSIRSVKRGTPTSLICGWSLMLTIMRPLMVRMALASAWYSVKGKGTP